ncbi:MAG: hypothetical protein IJM69_01445 [Firmicutes bacterium]|nr:hypothetical protein [Bacillota bacterium]
MKIYYIEKTAFLMIAIALSFVLRHYYSQQTTIIYAIVLLLALLPLYKECLLLPMDLLLGRTVAEGYCIGSGNLNKYEFFSYYTSRWAFSVNEKTLVLTNIFSLPTEEMENDRLPSNNRRVAITYYRLSKVLCNWEYVDRNDELGCDNMTGKKPEERYSSTNETVLEKLKRSFTEPIVRGFAVFLVAVGLLLGTVFTVNAVYWIRPIREDQSIQVEASYLSYSYKNGKDIRLYFSDLDVQYIDAECVTSDILRQLKQLSPGTQMTLWLHPNSDTIVQMVTNGETLLEFSETMENLRHASKGFASLGILFYSFALIGGIKILRREVY